MFFEGYIGAPPTLTVFSAMARETGTTALDGEGESRRGGNKTKRLDETLDMLGSILAVVTVGAAVPAVRRDEHVASSHPDTARSPARVSARVVTAA